MRRSGPSEEVAGGGHALETGKGGAGSACVMTGSSGMAPGGQRWRWRQNAQVGRGAARRPGKKDAVMLSSLKQASRGAGAWGAGQKGEGFN